MLAGMYTASTSCFQWLNADRPASVWVRWWRISELFQSDDINTFRTAVSPSQTGLFQVMLSESLRSTAVFENEFKHNYFVYLSFLQVLTLSKHFTICLSFIFRDFSLGWGMMCTLQSFHQEDVLHYLFLCSAQDVSCGRRYESNDARQNTPHLVIRSVVPSGAACVTLTACVWKRFFGKDLVSGGSAPGKCVLPVICEKLWWSFKLQTVQTSLLAE